MKPIVVGELRNRVELQSVSYAPDPTGARIATWTTFDSTWASLKGLTGREQERAKTIVATATHNATMRYRPDVTTAIRLSFNGRYFLVGSVINVEERNVALLLTLTEIIP